MANTLPALCLRGMPASVHAQGRLVAIGEPVKPRRRVICERRGNRRPHRACPAGPGCIDPPATQIPGRNHGAIWPPVPVVVYGGRAADESVSCMPIRPTRLTLCNLVGYPWRQKATIIEPMRWQGKKGLWSRNPPRLAKRQICE